MANFVASKCGCIDSETTIWNDDLLRKILDVHEKPLLTDDSLVADAIIIDEAQDMCRLYYRLLCWYQHACGNARFQLIVVGQADQCVYAKGKGGRCMEDTKAHLDYLTEDSALASLVDGPFTRVHLTTSFRLTPSTAHFVNSVCGSAIVGANCTHEDKRPIWFCCNLFQYDRVGREIERFMRLYGNVQLVTGSIKEDSNAPFKHIRNWLSMRGWLFANQGDTELQNKSVCYTCCGVKGTEENCTIIIQADSFAEYVTTEQRFVAITRPREQLVVFQHYKNRPWFKESPCDFQQAGADVYFLDAFRPTTPDDAEPRAINVTALLRSAEVLHAHMHKFCTIHENKADHPPHTLDLPASSVSFSTHAEQLEHAYGTIVPFAFAIGRRQEAPGFDRIFNRAIIIQNSAGNAAAAVEAVSSVLWREGRDIPNKESLLKRLASKKMNERDTAIAIVNHLRAHNMSDVAFRIITARDYEKHFPISQRHALRKLYDKCPETWSDPDCAHAAMAAAAYDGQHYLLAQMQHYDWANTTEHRLFIGECCRRLDGLMSDSVGECYERPVSWTCAPRKYDGLNYEIQGIHGRIDCFLDNVVYEFKTKKALEICDDVQTFVYMLVEACASDRSDVKGLLFNTRTKEKRTFHLLSHVKPDLVLGAILDIHLDHMRNVDTILADALPEKPLKLKRSAPAAPYSPPVTRRRRLSKLH